MRSVPYLIAPQHIEHTRLGSRVHYIKPEQTPIFWLFKGVQGRRDRYDSLYGYIDIRSWQIEGNDQCIRVQTINVVRWIFCEQIDTGELFFVLVVDLLIPHVLIVRSHVDGTQCRRFSDVITNNYLSRLGLHLLFHNRKLRRPLLAESRRSEWLSVRRCCLDEQGPLLAAPRRKDGQAKMPLSPAAFLLQSRARISRPRRCRCSSFRERRVHQSRHTRGR